MRAKAFHPFAAFVLCVASLVVSVTPLRAKDGDTLACVATVKRSTTLRAAPGAKHTSLGKLNAKTRVLAFGRDLSARWISADVARSGKISSGWVLARDVTLTRNCITTTSVPKSPLK